VILHRNVVDSTECDRLLSVSGAGPHSRLQRRTMSMPNRIFTVATASLASALMLLLLGGRGSAAPKNTGGQCKIDHDVCWKIGCKGFTGKLLDQCYTDCDVRLANCLGGATKNEAKPNKDAKPKKGIDGTPSGTWLPNPPKKGIDGTPSTSKWVPNSPAKGTGVPSIPASGTWNPSPGSSAKAPILRSGSGRR
jgi:hypothetical protein